jgi:hypothetical protein
MLKGKFELIIKFNFHVLKPTKDQLIYLFSILREMNERQKYMPSLHTLHRAQVLK